PVVAGDEWRLFTGTVDSTFARVVTEDVPAGVRLEVAYLPEAVVARAVAASDP
ncbi:MAG: hypothetical protein IT580_19650, partial [Verrucomicrobiales bacterium]|nr:hypothetical protein [Verrucomicrobiales bacterium]